MIATCYPGRFLPNLFYGGNLIKTTTRKITSIILFILPLLLSTGYSQAMPAGDHPSQAPNAHPATLPWAFQYIQRELVPPRDVGRYVSMSLLPFNNYLVASYYDATNHALMIASPWPDHAGNCGTANNWMCITLDDGGGQPTGMYTSLDLWGYAPDYWKMAISYYNQTSRSLMVSIYTCTATPCQGWRTDIVDAPDWANESVGLYSSVKFDSTGNAGVSFFSTDTSSMESILTYATQVLSNGTCGEGPAAGRWDCGRCRSATAAGWPSAARRYSP